MRARYAMAAMVVAAVLLLNVGTITGRERIASYGDNAYTMYPLRVAAARQWIAGDVPLWNPFQRAGAPLLADAFSGALYPGNFPFLLYLDHPRYYAIELVAVLHYVLAAVFMYAFLTGLELAPLACALGALLYAANGSLTWLTKSYIEAQNAAVWLPLIMLAVQRAQSRHAFWRWTTIGAVAVALQVFAGQPEYSFYGALIVGAYALTVDIQRRDRHASALVAFVAVWVFGAALAAVQLWPSAELATLSRRGLHVALAESLRHAVSPRAVLGWIVPGTTIPLPDPYPSVGTAYLGALAIAFAVEGVRGLDRRRVFFTVVLVIGFLLAIGPASPVARFAYELPGFGAFRYPYKHLFEVSFAAAVLSAIGADAFLRRRPGSARTVAAAAVVILGVLCSFLFGSAPLLGVVKPALPAWIVNPDDPLRRTFVAALGIVVVLPLMMVNRRSLAVAVALVATWVSYAGNRGDVVGHAGWQEIVEPPPAALIDVLRGDPSAPPSRYVLAVAGKDAIANYRQEFLTANYPSEFRVPAVHGCCPFLWAPLAQALKMTDDGVFQAPRETFSPANRTLDVLACRFLGNPVTTRYAPSAAPPLWQGADFALTERLTALAPLRFVDEARCGTAEDTTKMLQGKSADPRRVALVDCAERPVLPVRLASTTQAVVALRDQAPGRWHLATRVDGDLPGFVVLSQSDVPGWQARVDGQPLPIYRTYGLVQGMLVPPGEHDVVIQYRPSAVVRGALVSLAAVVVLLGASTPWWRRMSRRCEPLDGSR